MLSVDGLFFVNNFNEYIAWEACLTLTDEIQLKQFYKENWNLENKANEIIHEETESLSGFADNGRIVEDIFHQHLLNRSLEHWREDTRPGMRSVSYVSLRERNNCYRFPFKICISLANKKSKTWFYMLMVSTLLKKTK